MAFTSQAGQRRALVGCERDTGPVHENGGAERGRGQQPGANHREVCIRGIGEVGAGQRAGIARVRIPPGRRVTPAEQEQLP